MDLLLMAVSFWADDLVSSELAGQDGLDLDHVL